MLLTRLSPTRRPRRVTVLSVTGLGLGRAALGASMIARPRLLPGLLGVEAAAADRTTWAVQMLGGREVAVGLGSVVAARRGDRRALRLWLLAGLLCDGTDALVFGAALGSRRVPRPAAAASVAVAATAVAVQARELVR